jgi:hypothetical protein
MTSMAVHLLPKDALFLEGLPHGDNFRIVNAQERNGRSASRSTRF